MKRMLVWAGILASLLGPANAAGTVPGFSLTPQFDLQGKVMPGCKLYTIQAGTVGTPQNSYQDSALTILQPNPLTCDATGRLPQFFLADGQIKIRVTNSAGVQQFVGDNLLVVGPSSGGGGGGGSVDPTTVIATGDIKTRYGTGVLTGFVRLNGRTIGSATSGATERANADAQALFEYLWNNDANLVVSTGRGASANADWVANKTITLPDARGRVLSSLDDMGNTAAGVITSSICVASTTVLGNKCGLQSQTISIAQMPSHNHGGITSGQTANHAHNYQTRGAYQNIGYATGGSGLFNIWTDTSTLTTTAADTDHAHVISSQGGGSPLPTVQPSIFITTYIKL